MLHCTINQRYSFPLSLFTPLFTQLFTLTLAFALRSPLPRPPILESSTIVDSTLLAPKSHLSFHHDRHQEACVSSPLPTSSLPPTSFQLTYRTHPRSTPPLPIPLHPQLFHSRAVKFTLRDTGHTETVLDFVKDPARMTTVHTQNKFWGDLEGTSSGVMISFLNDNVAMMGESRTGGRTAWRGGAEGEGWSLAASEGRRDGALGDQALTIDGQLVFTGTIAGKSGTVAFRSTGHCSTEMKASFDILPNSAT